MCRTHKREIPLAISQQLARSGIPSSIKHNGPLNRLSARFSLTPSFLFHEHTLAHIKQHFATVSYQLRTGHAHETPLCRLAPLVIYIMTTHSCWLIVINFPKCLPCGPSSGKVRVERRRKDFLGRVREMFIVVFFFLACLPWFRLPYPEGHCSQTMAASWPI